MNNSDIKVDSESGIQMGRRTVALQTLSRRFRRRWLAGIAVGTGLVVMNTIIFRASIDEARAEAARGGGTVDALDRLDITNLAVCAVSFMVLAALAFKFFAPLDRTLAVEGTWLDAAEQQQLADNARRTFGAEVHEALDFGTDDLRLAMITDHLLGIVAPTHPSELLVADSSDAHMGTWAANRNLALPGCDVASPFDCPAVKRSRPYTATSSEAINACPHLRNRSSGSCSAHCVPVAFMGKALGVLHLTGKDGASFDTETIHRVDGLAEQLGTRIGTVRAFAKAQLQASTDSLTGLDNRRSIENELNERLKKGHHFTVAIADLDHFKKLNDTFGHDVGDRALRGFARAVRSILREGDLFARWGGEEFVVALPDVKAVDGANVLRRAQEALAELCAQGSVPTFTVSFGVTDTSSSPHLELLLRAADEALMRAKKSGRDAVCIAGVDELSTPDELDNRDRRTVLRAPDGDQTADDADASAPPQKASEKASEATLDTTPERALEHAPAPTPLFARSANGAPPPLRSTSR